MGILCPTMKNNTGGKWVPRIKKDSLQVQLAASDWVVEKETVASEGEEAIKA